MSWDPVWEDVFRHQAWGKYPGEDLIRFVARHFYGAIDRRQIKLLEVGCGPGANLWFMAREGFSIYGIDGSQTAIDQARERLDAECPGWKGQLWCGDMGQIPVEDGFFAAVIDNEAVYCNAYQTSRQIYQEMARVTHKGGMLYARTFARGSWGSDTGETLGHNAWRVAEGPLLNKGYARFTDHDEIEDLFQGFRIQEVELLLRSMENKSHEIKEWIILGEKI
jgi:SAM-dependent methyltransferase